jgi:hypothetical protein
MTLPHDIARCAGFGPTPDQWLDECHDCQRRTAPGGEVHMEPPAIIVFFCEYCIPPDRPEDQRLRELAAQLEVKP